MECKNERTKDSILNSLKNIELWVNLNLHWLGPQRKYKKVKGDSQKMVLKDCWGY